MLAALRASVPELVRGLNIAIALAASPRCPDVQCNPVVNVPDAPRCPGCVCQGAVRAAIEEPCPPCSLLYFGWAELILAIVVGGIIGYWARGYQAVKGQPVTASSSTVLPHRNLPQPIQPESSPQPSQVSAAAKALARQSAGFDLSSQ